MSEIEKRVHIVPTTLDSEQVGYLFDEISADQVIILSNQEPLGLDEEIEELPRERVEEVVRERTRCFETNSVRHEETDFYHFREALFDVFRIVYREKLEGNDIIINLAGGTKPVAIALAFASSLAEAGQLFYTAKRYTVGKNGEDNNEEKEIPVPGEPYAAPFASNPLELLSIHNAIPAQRNERTLLLGLLKASGPQGVRDLLVSMGMITEQPPANEEDKKERNRIIQRHHRYASNLVDAGLFEKRDSVYSLTDTGVLIAKLVDIIQTVEEEVEEEDEENH